MIIGKGKLIKFLNGKRIGVICKDKTFRIYKTEKKHFFRIYNGWAINKEVLKELLDIGIEWIEIHAYDTKTIYRTHISNFFNGLAIHYQNPKKEKDYQLILPLQYWQKFPMLPKKKVKEVIKQVNLQMVVIER